MERAPHIELVARRRVCRNALFEVFLDDIADEHGRRVSDYLSVVPLVADPEGVTGVAVLPIRADGAFGLMRVFRHPQGALAWEIPKGFVDQGERPFSAALRELKEETGLDSGEARLTELGYVSPVPGVVRAKVRLYAAAVDGPARSSSGEFAHGILTFFTAERVFAMAEAGEIEEPCTLLAAYRYLQRTGVFSARP